MIRNSIQRSLFLRRLPLNGARKKNVELLAKRRQVPSFSAASISNFSNLAQVFDSKLDPPSSSSPPSESSNVSASDMAQYGGYNLDKWWSSDEFYALRSLNQLRVPFIVQTLEDSWCLSGDKTLNNPLEVLDIGCGGGLLSEALARRGTISQDPDHLQLNVTGIDPVPLAIQVAQEHAQQSPSSLENLHYECSSLQDFSSALNASRFHAVIISEVLEHVDNVQPFLEQALRCLRPGGHLFITTIAQTTQAYLVAILGAERLIRLVPRGTHEYRKLVSPTALRLVLEQDMGCSVEKVHGMWLNPITLQWSWGQDQSICYALAARKDG